ncbi:hypothetical protein BDP27DRAFT_1481721 [Rhodocollybia butyracea]|uniref:Uncharacterized protein n=1 Tax=Rhodocollybia butyracea TaxID=206335 RepID=A0A9P5PFY4_9AGAR|nr:hypothetical protein BDP27DRAFT_1481721 [Rhodocollybia butyracea]
MPVPDLHSTYGAMLIGVFFAIFLQGVLTLQTVIYYDSYPKDRILTKLVLAIGESTWELDVNVTFIGLSTFVCQLFFLRRIWIFSRKRMKNIIMVGLLGALCAVTLIVDVVAMVEALKQRSVTISGGSKKVTKVLVAFISGAVADISIALLLSYYVWRNRGGYKRTDSVLALIVRLNSRSKLRASLDETLDVTSTNLRFDSSPRRGESLSMGPLSNLTSSSKSSTATKNQPELCIVNPASKEPRPLSRIRGEEAAWSQTIESKYLLPFHSLSVTFLGKGARRQKHPTGVQRIT